MEGSQCPRGIPFLLPIPHLISPETWSPSDKTCGSSMLTLVTSLKFNIGVWKQALFLQTMPSLLRQTRWRWRIWAVICKYLANIRTYQKASIRKTYKNFKSEDNDHLPITNCNRACFANLAPHGFQESWERRVKITQRRMRKLYANWRFPIAWLGE